MKISKTFIIILLVLSLTLMALPQPKPVRAATRYYVKASGGNDSNAGTSWATAFATLNKALSVSTYGDEIWVAQGTYYPSTTDVNAYFYVSGKSVYGGFAGTETAINQRDISAHPTILSGEIQGDGDLTNNIKTIVKPEVSSGSSCYPITLDGLTVTGAAGAAIVASSSSGSCSGSVLNNLIVTNNKGRGFYTSNTTGKEFLGTINNSTFSYNQDGGLYMSLATVNISNTTIDHNGNTSYGGGIYAKGFVYGTWQNVTIAYNHANSGGGIDFDGGGVTIKNVTIAYNIGDNWGAAIRVESGAVTFINVVMGGNTPTSSYECAKGSGTTTFYYSLLYYSSGSCTITNGVNGNITNVDPKIGGLQNNGGTTLTIAPLAGSPLIDAGDPSNYTNPDQRGVTRPQDGNGDGNALPDIGAVEYYFDSTPPQVSSINRLNSSPINASSVQYQVTFSEAVTGVDTSDFVLTTSGITGASVTSVSGSSAIYTVTVNTGSGDGTLRLDVKSGATIQDTAGNNLTGLPYTSGQVYTIDKTPPSVSSITRLGTSPTNASSVQYQVTFSENVTGVSSADFSLTASGLSGTSITSVTGSGASYTVTVNSGSGSGTLRLDVPSGATIYDGANNAITGIPYTSGAVYEIDRIAPLVQSVTRLGASPTNASEVIFQVVFSEAVTGVAMSNFYLTTSGVVSPYIVSVSGSGTTYTVTVNTGSGSGTIRLDVIN